MSIHQRIRDRRIALGLNSQEALAKLVGVTWQTVQQWEKEGGTAPNRNRIKKVAEVLEVTPGWLQNGSHEASGQLRDPAQSDVVAQPVAATPPWIEPEAYRLLALYYSADIESREQIMRYAESMSSGGAERVVGRKG